jgi:hypothetical protein
LYVKQYHIIFAGRLAGAPQRRLGLKIRGPDTVNNSGA